MHIKVLGIVASPRSGNSEYILNYALDSVKNLTYELDIDIISFKGKKIQPCIGCFKCKKNNGLCILQDDFEEMRNKWLKADVVIYSLALFNLSIPGQLKCFIDRLGQTMSGYYGIRSTRPLKVTGNIVQGAHLYGGQEIAIANMILHQILAKCIPVAGDGWESYIGAAGWTGGESKRDAISNLHGEGDKDTLVTMKAACSVVKRAIELAAVIKCGGTQMINELKEDEHYIPFINRIEDR